MHTHLDKRERASKIEIESEERESFREGEGERENEGERERLCNLPFLHMDVHMYVCT
jgi:hypothetical protein